MDYNGPVTGSTAANCIIHAIKVHQILACPETLAQFDQLQTDQCELLAEKKHLRQHMSVE